MELHLVILIVAIVFALFLGFVALVDRRTSAGRKGYQASNVHSGRSNRSYKTARNRTRPALKAMPKRVAQVDLAVGVSGGEKQAEAKPQSKPAIRADPKVGKSSDWLSALKLGRMKKPELRGSKPMRIRDSPGEKGRKGDSFGDLMYGLMWGFVVVICMFVFLFADEDMETRVLAMGIGLVCAWNAKQAFEKFVGSDAGDAE